MKKHEIKRFVTNSFSFCCVLSYIKLMDPGNFFLQMVDLDLNEPADEVYYDTEPQFCTQLPVVDAVDESPDPVGGRNEGLDDEGSGRGGATQCGPSAV